MSLGSLFASSAPLPTFPWCPCHRASPSGTGTQPMFSPPVTLSPVRWRGELLRSSRTAPSTPRTSFEFTPCYPPPARAPPEASTTPQRQIRPPSGTGGGFETPASSALLPLAGMPAAPSLSRSPMSLMTGGSFVPLTSILEDMIQQNLPSARVSSRDPECLVSSLSVGSRSTERHPRLMQSGDLVATQQLAHLTTALASAQKVELKWQQVQLQEEANELQRRRAELHDEEVQLRHRAFRLKARRFQSEELRTRCREVQREMAQGLVVGTVVHLAAFFLLGFRWERVLDPVGQCARAKAPWGLGWFPGSSRASQFWCYISYLLADNWKLAMLLATLLALGMGPGLASAAGAGMAALTNGPLVLFPVRHSTTLRTAAWGYLPALRPSPLPSAPQVVLLLGTYGGVIETLKGDPRTWGSLVGLWGVVHWAR